MPEQLSQAQIDALLNRMNTGGEVVEPAREEEPDKAKEYDFKSPKKFTKEQLKALDGLHENFSRMLSSYLSGLLRDFCEIEMLQIEEESYYEYNNALPDNALLGMIDFLPEEKKYSEAFFIMDISTSIGYLMVERLLGGGSAKPFTPDRDYTDVEIAILEKVLSKATNLMQDAWGNYLDVKMPLRSIETNPRLLQVLSPEDTVIIVMMNIKLGSMTGNISICIPAENLEEVIDNFSMRYARSAKKQDPQLEQLKKQWILDELTESSLEIKAVLDSCQMSLKDILQLQVSDVVMLNKDIKSDITVMVDNELWYTAKLGETGMKKSIKLNKPVE